MLKGSNESHQLFLLRLYKAAELAEIDDDNMIHSRFRAGLLRPIRVFSIQQSSKTFEDWMTHSDGWWNANKPIGVSLVENPFVAEEDASYIVKPIIPATIHSDGQVYSNLKNTNSALDTAGNARKSNSFSINQNMNHRRVRFFEPEIEQLNAKLRTLELHQLENASDSKGVKFESVSDLRQNRVNELNESDLVNLIKRAVKDELRSSNTYNNYDRKRFNGSTRKNEDYFQKSNYSYNRRRYNQRYDQNQDYQGNRNNRRVFFDNDYANPSEGFYCYQDNRGNNTHSDRRNPNDNPVPHTSRQYNGTNSKT